jgi:hypothetical protein
MAKKSATARQASTTRRPPAAVKESRVMLVRAPQTTAATLPAEAPPPSAAPTSAPVAAPKPAPAKAGAMFLVIIALHFYLPS